LSRLIKFAATLPAIGFAVAVAIGIATAFACLRVSSLWQDELYTRWIVDPAIGLPAAIQRALYDAAPPVYYVTLWPFTRLLGGDEVGLRLPSALCASAAVLLLILAGARFSSLPARLFAAAMATGSVYWASQAQNARTYGLGLLLSTGIALLALAALRDRERRGVLGWLLAVMLLATFTHFYLLFESLAVLAVLFLYRPRDRALLTVAGAALLGLAVLYLRLVINRLTYFALDSSWIPGDAGWYGLQLESAAYALLPRAAMLALAICAALIVVLLVQRKSLASPEGSAPIVLCLAVPALMTLAAIAAAVATIPNFHHRYLLLASPFLWIAFALLYDRSVERATPLVRTGAGLALAALVLWTAVTIALWRQKPSGEPFRESAAAITALPACRDAVIPFVLSERKRWYRVPEAVEPIRSAYAHYLAGFAKPEPLFAEDIRTGKLGALKGPVQQRVDQGGCPVLAWAVHAFDEPLAREVGRGLLAAAGRGDAADRLELVTFREGGPGFLITVKRP
jgi:hypothetical protein